jgi:hypothetical protein
MSSTSRSNQKPWSTAYEIAPPAACNTLRNNRNIVEWGYTCVFAEENGPEPFAINTACMPWIAAPTLPASDAFYSPATACPTSWTPVATRTASSGAGDQWVDGETALTCCPSGFVADNTGGCSPGSSGTWPVVQCGEADAEEYESRTYTAGSWPTNATPRVTALQLRYQATDTGAVPSASSSIKSGHDDNGGGSGGLSTAVKAALGTAIPLFFLLSALAFFLLWRRRKNRNQASSKGIEEEHLYPKSMPFETANHPRSPGLGLLSQPVPYAQPRHGTDPATTHETPEWNVEMDAVEAERRRYLAVQGSLFPTAATADKNLGEVAELGGMARVPRKPIAPVEIDSEPWRGGMGAGDR